MNDIFIICLLFISLVILPWFWIHFWMRMEDKFTTDEISKSAIHFLEVITILFYPIIGIYQMIEDISDYTVILNKGFTKIKRKLKRN